MNPVVAADEPQSALVDVIELKWLLAGAGMHLHVERMMGDDAYATQILTEALASSSPILRAAAERLRGRLLRG